MTQIITDKPTPWKDYFCKVMNTLEEYEDEIDGLLIITRTTNEDVPYMIDFNNCDTYDILQMLEICRIETYKHELWDTLGIDQEDYFEEGDSLNV